MIASQGDTWDLIAYRTLGSEYYVMELMIANPLYHDVIIFQGGEVLVIPIIEETASNAPWRD